MSAEVGLPPAGKAKCRTQACGHRTMGKARQRPSANTPSRFCAGASSREAKKQPGGVKCRMQACGHRTMGKARQRPSANTPSRLRAGASSREAKKQPGGVNCRMQACGHGTMGKARQRPSVNTPSRLRVRKKSRFMVRGARFWLPCRLCPLVRALSRPWGRARG